MIEKWFPLLCVVGHCELDESKDEPFGGDGYREDYSRCSGLETKEVGLVTSKFCLCTCTWENLEILSMCNMEINHGDWCKGAFKAKV